MADKPRFEWAVAPCIFAIISCASLGFYLGTAFADDWNRVAVQKIEMQQACISGNDRACRMYEVDYGR